MTSNERMTAEIVPVEAIPTEMVFGTNDPSGVVARATLVANALRDAIRVNGMSVKISGRDYVKVDGWTFMGSMLGVFPRTKRVDALRDEDGTVYGYEAEVELLTASGAVVGGSVAECSHHERTWSDRDEFAIKSMAQTRAVGKAYRMSFGFVMQVAGYEVTPAEEMSHEPDERRPGVSRTITARRAAVCPSCKEPIGIGASITEVSPNRWIHADCA